MTELSTIGTETKATYGRPLIAFLVFCVFIFTARQITPYFVTNVDPISVFQYSVFPIVAIFFLFFRIGERRVPRIVILGAVLFVFGGWIINFTHIAARGNTVVVARLKDDTLQSQTSRLREHLERFSPARGAARFQQDPSTPQTSEDAQTILATYSRVSAIVWGTVKWLQVDFRKEAPKFFSSFSESSHAKFLQRMFGTPDLLITTSVSRMGVSFEPTQESARFIAELVAIREYRDSTIERHAVIEQSLRSVALIRAGWSSNAHRAFPQFRIGTLHLLDTLENEIYSGPEIRCAIRAFTAGLMQLRPGDNSELKAALLNNLGVAYFVQAASERKPPLRKLARMFWQRSKKVAREKNLLETQLKSPAISHYNLRILKGALKHHKKVRHAQRRKNR